MKKVIFLLLVISAQGCGPASYYFTQAASNSPSGAPTGAPGTSPSGTPTCTPGVTTQDDVRIVFMVDNSDSTTTTDPNYAVRKVSIDNFLATYGSKTNFTYSFGYFGGTTADGFNAKTSKFVRFPSSGMPSGTYFGNTNMLQSALAAYLKVGIGGNTPYDAAFSAMSNTVAADAAATSNHYLYAVIFMSDGQPTDVSSADMTGLAQELTGSAKYVGLSTLYFGPEPSNPNDPTDTNAQAIANLQTLASAGGGKFVDSNMTTQIVISDLITIPGTCGN